MKNIFTIQITVPPSTVNVYIGCSYKKALSDSKNCSPDYKDIIKGLETSFNNIEKEIIHGFSYSEEGIYIIALRGFNNTWEYFDFLNHEATHCVQDILTDRGCDSEHEFRAYLHQFIVKSIREELYRKFGRQEKLDMPCMPSICPQELSKS